MKSQQYRDVIDTLVRECHEGQGQIGPRRVRDGLWNANATQFFLPDQYAINQLIKTLDVSQREVLACMLQQAFEGGVFETLKLLEEQQIPPFMDGYEGGPIHDFIGRLDDWDWPE